MTTADHTHVDESEAADGLKLMVGDGNVDTAPEVAPKVSLLEGQPALILGSVVTIATALLASPALPIPAGVKAVLAAVIAVAGIFGIRSRVTPVAAPKLDADTPLTP